MFVCVVLASFLCSVAAQGVSKCSWRVDQPASTGNEAPIESLNYILALKRIGHFSLHAALLQMNIQSVAYLSTMDQIKLGNEATCHITSGKTTPGSSTGLLLG